MNDADFVKQFESGQAPNGRFNHEDHVRAAWLMLQSRGPLQGMRDYDEALRRLTRSLGVEEKYDAALTEHYLALIAGRIIERPADDWETFKNMNADIFEAAMVKSLASRVSNAPSASF